MEREKKMVSIAMIALFLCFIVVYSLFYQIKWAKLLTTIQPASSQNALLPSQEEADILLKDLETLEDDLWIYLPQNKQDTIEDSSLVLFSWVTNSYIVTGTVDTLPVPANSVQQASASTDLDIFENKGPTILSGTEMFFWTVSGIELLGLSPDYILKDEKDVYYAYFAEEPRDLKESIAKLWGDIYTINSESEILKHQLFGKKVVYINIPEYKNKIVLMLINVKDQVWFIQVDYSRYYQIKWYLKSLFID